MTQSVVVPVIMSGGSGTRLWPLSRKAHPKQMHALTADLTLIQHTIERVRRGSDDVRYAPPIIILNESQLELAKAQVVDLGIEEASFVVEPVGRNTAPVAAVAAQIVAERHGEDALVLLMPADHHVEDVDGFRGTVHRAASLGLEGKVVTFGIQPVGPATGFGYIQRGDVTGTGYVVQRFTEKPDLETATRFLEEGGYYWNAGIFMFQPTALMREMGRHEPGMLEACRAAVAKGGHVGNVLALDTDSFAACPSNSFDYAVMEKTDLAAVVPADFGWSDVGSWSALWDVAAKDPQDNAIVGDAFVEDASGCIVLTSGPKVGVLGTQDLVIVATHDAVLVAEKKRDQDVKKIVEHLKKEGRLDLL